MFKRPREEEEEKEEYDGYRSVSLSSHYSEEENGESKAPAAPSDVVVGPRGLFDEDSLSMSTSSSRSGSPSGEEDEDAAAARAQLLLYAKTSAENMKKATSTIPADSSSLSATIAKGSGRAEVAAAAALKNFKEELLKPVTASSALVVVNAEDESADILSRVVAKKIPPPSAGDTKKLRQLKYVDHSTIQYREVRKDFYVVPPDVKNLSQEEMKALLKELDGAKVHGRAVPRPLRSWHATGLPDSVLKVLEKHEYHAPFAVQSLATPALMSGRDLLVTAKTGSGKTLSYALPLIRHCADQPRCGKDEGPIGLVLVPTQELAVQVYGLLHELGAAVGMRCVASYGSTSLSDNIKEAKAGAELMVATPGRLLDLLTVNGGRTMNLSSVTMAVIDEADRLFDSGFMEHVVAFLKNIRPDVVLGMISATMPKELRKVIAKFLKDPVEITVGGRPTPASNVVQDFYFFDEDVYEADEEKRDHNPRLLKLLSVLGEECAGGEKLALVFTQRREEVDELLGKLSALGYNNRVATLYSGMDPIDREFALEHFAPGKQFVLIATAVAERGLDIPSLGLVINYRLPNHYEAYVHRIGRTGRAGRSGRAISFFTRGKDDDYAPELAEGLERADQHVPEELYEIATKVRELRKSGDARYNAGFFRGYMKAKKQRFTDRNQKAQMREFAKAAGLAEFVSSSSSGEDSDLDSDEDADIVAVSTNRSQKAGEAASNALTVHRGAKQSGALALSSAQEDRVSKALSFAAKTTAAATAGGAADGEKQEAVRFEHRYPTNDLPDAVRGRLSSSSFLKSVGEETETVLIRKGTYFDPRYKGTHRMREGEEPLSILIIGRTVDAVREARKRLDEAKAEVMSRQGKKGSVTNVVL